MSKETDLVAALAVHPWDTDIELYFETMQNVVYVHPVFGIVECGMWTVDGVITQYMLDQVAADLAVIAKKNAERKVITSYGVFVYSIEGNKIKYAKGFTQC